MHAQETLSVESEVRVSSISGVREYTLPDNIGEIIRVWFDDGSQLIELEYLRRGAVLDNLGSSIGTPRLFYTNVEMLGLDPIPSKAASTSYNTVSTVDTHQELTFQSVGPLAQSYQVASEITVGAVTLYLRKLGNPSGQIYCEIASGSVGGTTVPNAESKRFDVEALETFYNWIAFSWLRSPVNLASTTYWLRLRGDTDYNSSYVTGAHAVQWGVDASSPTYTSGNFAIYSGGAWTEYTTRDALFEVHPWRGDIIVEHYKNVTNPMSADTDVPETPTRYHRTIVDMVTAIALRKDSYNPQLAAYYDGLATQPKLIALAQALKKSRGRRAHTPWGGIPYTREGSIVINNP